MLGHFLWPFCPVSSHPSHQCSCHAVYRGNISFSFLLVIPRAWPHLDLKRPFSSPNIRQTTEDGFWEWEILGKLEKNLPYKVHNELFKPWTTKKKRKCKDRREQRQHKGISVSVLSSVRDVVGNIPSLFPSQLDCVGSGPFWAESGPFWRSHSQPPNQWLETTSRKPHSLSLLFCPSHTSARETAAPPWAAHSNPYPKPWLFTTFPVVFLFVPPGRQERHTHTPLFWKVKHLRRLEFQAQMNESSIGNMRAQDYTGFW